MASKELPAETFEVHYSKFSAADYMNRAKVLITRSLRESEKLYMLLKQYPELDPIIVPAIEFERLPTPSSFQSDIETAQFIFFTSKAGIAFFFEALTELPLPVATLKRFCVGVQGKGSAELFNDKAGRWPDIISTSGEAESFVTTITACAQWRKAKEKHVLLIKGTLSRNVLGPALSEFGAKLSEHELYKTIKREKPADFESSDASDAILLLFSPSAADAVAAWQLPLSATRRVIAFGPTTSERALSHGFRISCTLEEQDIDSLISNVVKIAQSKA